MRYTVSKDVCSPQETIDFAEMIGKKLRKGDIIAYRGGLGAGKTTFTRGLALGMGLPDEVSSPTFAIVNEYRNEKTVLYHFDMYRIMNEESLETTGFFDYADGDSVIAAEWSENVAEFLPPDTIMIELEITGENSRHITVTGDERFADIGN